MTTVAKPLSLEEEQEYRRDSGHGFDHYCSVTNFGVRRLLATIEQQRACVAVLEEAIGLSSADPEALRFAYSRARQARASHDAEIARPLEQRIVVLEEALREMLGIVTIVRRGGAVPHEAVDRMLTKARGALADKEVSG
jgi:hypothetical protein